MNTITFERKVAVLSALLEGCSIRSTARMTGVHKTTIMRLLVETGEHCESMMANRLKNLPCTEIEADEIWTFVGKKQRHLTLAEESGRPELGDQYAFIGFDPTSKLVVAYIVGKRDAETTLAFLRQLRARIAGHIQLSTDAFVCYEDAVETVFGGTADYAQVEKRYGPALGADGGVYQTVLGVSLTERSGRPDPNRICTSYVERHNGTIRQQVRRFTRKTLCFSKKLQNLRAAMALYVAHYNFCRIHGSLRMSPAMAIGLTPRAPVRSDRRDPAPRGRARSCPRRGARRTPSPRRRRR